ncbi:MAG: hypothetical protein HYS65_14855 [Betaproteobacteria bacterium]|nr:hypothetical protein [Betaproteobacteria bacterium]
MFAYDLASNDVPGVQPHEETGYWRDVGTIDALKAAQNDVSGFEPRFKLWNPQWPIRGESHAELLRKIRDWKADLDRTNSPVNGSAAQARAVTSSD